VNYVSCQKGLGCTGFRCAGVGTGVRVRTGGRNLQNTVLRASGYEQVPPALPESEPLVEESSNISVDLGTGTSGP
jgi:hypothetical protein